jgi:transcription antitermination factor NusG
MTTTKRYDTTKQWYAIHTYSGYEEKVAESIRQRADSLDMSDKIYEVLVPKEKMIEIKNGKRRVVEKRIFQGYVLVLMKLSASLVQAQILRQLNKTKLKRFKSVWVLSSLSIRLISHLEKW